MISSHLNAMRTPNVLPPEHQAALAWKCAHQIFEETAARTPDAPAIISDKRSYSYREVNAISDRIARHIVKMDLPVESMIGVYADRSPELLIAFVSILKAGCAYVPLDTHYPVDRLKYIVGEINAKLVLTENRDHPFGIVAGTEFRSVEELAKEDPGRVADFPRALTPANLAYVIFTSGSTGKPKGAMLEHRGLVNFCHYFKHFHGYGDNERCAQLVRPGFDASISEIAGFFFAGICVCIPNNDVMANPARIVDYIVERKITRAFVPTPLAELLLDEEWPAKHSLIELQTGGEALRKRPTKRHGFRLLNVYGATEVTNISHVYDVELAEDDSRAIPVGYPVSNTDALIVDENLKPVAPGETGEILFDGIQLARCYLNRPELNAERFIVHPVDKTPGARAYRTGDLGRFRSDGAIEFVGRNDFQIKIHGQRIELGEIENAIYAAPGVKQSVVVPVMRDGKADSLTAYWVALPESTTGAAEIENSLRANLTPAMIPARFIRLHEFPLTPNGKIDRRKLESARVHSDVSGPLSVLSGGPLPEPFQTLLQTQTAHGIFEETAAQNPDAVAIECGGQTLTSGELNRRAELIARHLIAAGAVAESKIAVYADRSPELVAAYLGILKAGCCYLPLDVTYPPERLKFMAADAQIAIILSESEKLSFSPAAGVKILLIKTLVSSPIVEKAPLPTVLPGHLAYVFYTSGTTGRPKGVELEHRGLVNLIMSYRVQYEIKMGSRGAMFIRPGFDASMIEIACLLGNGARLIIPDDSIFQNPTQLIGWLLKNKIEILSTATPLMELLLDEPWPADSPMRTIFVGGEQLRKRPGAGHNYSLVNSYGPTENTVASTEHIVEAAGSDSRRVPIGLPHHNVEILILDGNLQPVPRGAEGEIYLGGNQLARGYVNSPELTREKFILNEAAQRLYRTGDLARLRADGVLEFLGRADNQVKIRTHRIELGEIESLMLEIAGVKQAAVVPIPGVDGANTGLAAFYSASAEITPDDFSVPLRARLPDYMVPAHFYQLPALPLTPNGKIDRRALHIPGVGVDQSASEQPRDDLETSLLAIWSGVLNSKSLRVTDSFIESGGTSLSALRIVSQIRKKLGRDIAAGQIFECATVATLAERMRHSEKNPAVMIKSNTCLVQIHAGKSGVAPVFCLHGFGGHVFQFYLLAKHLSPDIPVFALRASGLESGEKPDDSFPAMAARYLDLILPVAKGRPVHFVGYSMGGPIAFAAAHLLRERKHAIGMLAILDSFAPGYPRLLPFSQRMKEHVGTLIAAPWAEKKSYLGKRLSNISQRAHFMFGIPYTPPEERHGVDSNIPPEVFWAHRKATDSAVFKRFEGEITLLKADTKPNVPGTDFSDPYLGWRPFASSISMELIPGTHWTMVKEPGIQRIAAVITARMASARPQ